MSESSLPQNPLSQNLLPESLLPENLRQLDARGLRCPLPLLRLKQTLHGMAPGGIVEVLTTDPASVRDFQAFLRQGGHELLELREQARQEIHGESHAAPHEEQREKQYGKPHGEPHKALHEDSSQQEHKIALDYFFFRIRKAG